MHIDALMPKYFSVGLRNAAASQNCCFRDPASCDQSISKIIGCG